MEDKKLDKDLVFSGVRPTETYTWKLFRGYKKLG